MTTIITRAGKGSPLTNNEMDSNLTNLNTYKVETNNPSTTGTLTHSGDIVLSGSGKRITGDFSNATIANRVMFQTSAVNGATTVNVIPNGTSLTAGYNAFNAADPTNAGQLNAFINGSEVSFRSAIQGTGTYLPMTFYTGGSERMRIGTDGQLGIAGPNYGTAGQVLTSNGGATAPSWGAPSGVPSGTVAHFAMNSAPSGWIKANGAAVSRTVYAALFAAIGTTYGAGDGATTFNLPDCRGEFLRGLDDGRGVDAGRVVGSAQLDEIKSHTHAEQKNTANAGVPNSGAYGGGEAYTSTTGATGGAETRPRNIAMLVCIKY